MFYSTPVGLCLSIETPELYHYGAVCVEFWYHMYGLGVGMLYVTKSSSPGDHLLEEIANLGDQWNNATVTVNIVPGNRVSTKVMKG